MKKQNLTTEFVFLHNLKYIRISPREEKNIQRLLEDFGTLQNVPSTEFVTACYTNKTRDEFIDDEDYFFFPIHELTSLNEVITEKRRSTFLNFKSRRSEISSK
jgi:hypothetical protein